MKHILYIFNVPAFYKTNLLNRLSSFFKITGLFIGRTNQVMTGDVFKDSIFSPIVLSDDDMDRKIRGIKRIPLLLKTIRKLKPDFIVYCGWDNIDMITASFLTPRKKNCIICESSIFESRISGINGLLKRIIISRYSKAFPSGIPHRELLKQLKFNGEIHITGSVGVNTHFNLPSQDFNTKPFKYIFIGRLIEIKGVELLVDVFNETGKALTIVGEGPLLPRLKEKAKDNIELFGRATREEIDYLLHNHHCLILPSKSEPWGLVVEEALQCGLPVIASSNVGSSIDLIKKYNSGIIYPVDDKFQLSKALVDMEYNYDHYRENAVGIDFEEREQEYINSFVQAFH